MPHVTEDTPARSPLTPLPTIKENAQSPSDHSTTEPNDSYHDMAFKRLASMIEEWINDDANCIMNLTTLCHMYGKLLRDEGQEKAVRGYSLKNMIKRHFGMRLVFHRPNKCTVSQYVFSSEVQRQGQLLRDVGGWRRHKKEKKRKSWHLMKWCALMS